MNSKMLIVGGDIRQLTVADELISDGLNVSVTGFDSTFFEKPYTYIDVKSAVKENDIIIFGLPMTKDGKFINTPCYSSNILLTDIIDNCDKPKIIIGGMIDELTKNILLSKNCKVYDYYLREELIIENVIPTVEGALSIALEETPFTLSGSECLICGFGRIGKLLAKTLTALNCKVTVSARKLEDFAWINCYGYTPVHTSKIKESINKYKIIFNTVPKQIIDEECLKRTNKDCLIIDLASKPGGTDFSYAKLLGVKVIWALSLPGKVAPKTAGIIIKKTICNILGELGVMKWTN